MSTNPQKQPSSLASLPVVVLGAGGHASVVIDTLKANRRELLGVVAPDLHQSGRQSIYNLPIIPSDQDVERYAPDEIELAMGVGSAAAPQTRIRLFRLFSEKGYRFTSVIHPSACLSSSVELEEGVQIFKGANIQPGVKIGKNSIVNTSATIDHDCSIAEHAHIAPNATLCGNVTIENGAHIGASSTIIEGKTIPPFCIVGAGAVVTQSWQDASKLIGIPAKPYAS